MNKGWAFICVVVKGNKEKNKVFIGKVNLKERIVASENRGEKVGLVDAIKLCIYIDN